MYVEVMIKRFVIGIVHFEKLVKFPFMLLHLPWMKLSKIDDVFYHVNAVFA